jgi:hypothetical protein
MEVVTMAIGVDSSKSAARPSHEAIEHGSTSTDTGNNEQKKIDHVAMEAAKRSGNRIVNNLQETPDSKIFTK